MTARRSLLLGASLFSVALPARAGEVTTFDAGSVVIPMDSTWQDEGILDAYGLVYGLLLEGIQVHWVIDGDKEWDGVDIAGLSTYGTDETSSDAAARDFAGGPFVVAAADVDRALPLIEAWSDAGWSAVAFTTAEAADLEVARTLYVAPSIAVFEDGAEDIAWDYLNAAGIPDGDGEAWGASSPGNLSGDEITGADETVSGDGALWAEDGYPAYCHLNAMHWEESDIAGVVMEIRDFTADPLSSSLFECAAAETIENDLDYGHMLSTGIEKVGINRGRATFDLTEPGLELFQIHGPWGSTGGSLPDFDGVFHSDVAFVVGDDGDELAYMVASGRVDGDPSNGRVTLLAGHEYAVDLPYSSHDELNAVRVFLNSYFAADCASLSLGPDIELDGLISAGTTSLTVDLDWANFGEGRARDASLTLTLPSGLVFDSASDGGLYDSGDHEVDWALGTVVSGDMGDTETLLDVSASGTYAFQATLVYYVEATRFEVTWEGEIDFSLDRDGDRLTDEEEADLGTDPLDPDTDDDGLGDGDEVLDIGTDPLDEDSDDDGLTDGEEVLDTGTDPLDEDSDDDGLTDGDEVEVFDTDPLDADSDDDDLLDGEEVWETGTDPLDEDSDDDDLTDGEEVDIHGTDPLDPDTDDGTVEDGVEVGRGTDPLDPADDLGGGDGGSTDGGATDGGSTDGGATDGGSTDGGSTDGGSTDGGSTDGGSTDGGATDGGSTDGGSTDGGATDGGSTDGGSGDGGSTDGGATDGGSGDGGGPDGGAGDGGGPDGGAGDGGGPDGGTTDGGAGDGGGPDGGTTDGGTSDGGGPDGGTTDGGTTDGGTSDGGGPDGGTTDGGTSDGGTSDGGTSDGGTSDGGASDGGADLEPAAGAVLGGCNGCASAPTGSKLAAWPMLALGLLMILRRRR